MNAAFRLSRIRFVNEEEEIKEEEEEMVEECKTASDSTVKLGAANVSFGS